MAEEFPPVPHPAPHAHAAKVPPRRPRLPHRAVAKDLSRPHTARHSLIPVHGQAPAPADGGSRHPKTTP